MTGGLRASPTPLTEVYDTVLVDLDGVVYRGAAAVRGAAQALAAARAAGQRVVFVTNNASRTPETVAAHLVELGVPAGPADVVTAASAAAHLLQQRLPAGARVLVTGAPALVQAVSDAGLTAVSSADDRPAAVLSGYDNSIDYSRLAEATLAVAAGSWWVAANLDSTLPSPRGLLPGNGALAQVVATATGRRPVSVGKPERALYDEAVRRTGARRALVVGDRLDTDVAGATAAGIDSLVVLTGVAGPADLLHARASDRPTYLAADLSGLHVPHPGVTLVGDVASCGDSSASLDGDTLSVRLTGPAPEHASAVDGLRAACAVAWAAADAGRLPAAVRLVGLELD